MSGYDPNFGYDSEARRNRAESTERPRERDPHDRTPPRGRRGHGECAVSDLRRRTLLAGVASGLLATSGCLGLVSGDEPLAFESAPASVAESALSETGYERTDAKSPSISREVTIAGQTREVTVTNHVALYEKSVDLGPAGTRKAAAFALVTTPQVRVAGQSFNPVGEFSTERLVREFGSRFGGPTVDRKVNSRSVSALGTTVTVEEFVGTTTVQGQEVDVSMHVSRFEHAEDYVIAVGVHPRKLDGEAENVRTLLSNVEH